MTAIATGLTPAPSTADDPSSTAVRLRRYLGAACLPGVFVLMILGTLVVDPLDDSASSTTMFEQAAGHLGTIQVLAWLELLCAPVGVAGLLAVVGAVRRRGAGWANAVGVLAVLTAVGQVAISLNHLVLVGLAKADMSAAQRVDALDSFHHVGGPMPVLFFLSALAYPLAGVAASRAGLVPKAVLVPSLLFFLTVFLPDSEIGQYVPLVVGVVLGGWIGRGLLARR
ncbi:hypothetical protein [Nocardioides sp. KR10-350]|uniref:hypothetical protein n=1 Tax=Nocardioides cheoyonin TaxID=3156615 RepID=UPI0032B5F6CE